MFSIINTLCGFKIWNILYFGPEMVVMGARRYDTDGCSYTEKYNYILY